MNIRSEGTLRIRNWLKMCTQAVTLVSGPKRNNQCSYNLISEELFDLML
jgi:hypothetical protein